MNRHTFRKIEHMSIKFFVGYLLRIINLPWMYTIFQLLNEMRDFISFCLFYSFDYCPWKNFKYATLLSSTKHTHIYTNTHTGMCVFGTWIYTLCSHTQPFCLDKFKFLHFVPCLYVYFICICVQSVCVCVCLYVCFV